MTPGALIAGGFWGGFVALTLYGLSFDVRRWLKNRQEPYEPLTPDPSGLPVEVLEFQGHTWSWVGLSVEDREWLATIGSGGLKW